MDLGRRYVLGRAGWRRKPWEFDATPRSTPKAPHRSGDAGLTRRKMVNSTIACSCGNYRQYVHKLVIESILFPSTCEKRQRPREPLGLRQSRDKSETRGHDPGLAACRPPGIVDNETLPLHRELLLDNNSGVARKGFIHALPLQSSSCSINQPTAYNSRTGRRLTTLPSLDSFPPLSPFFRSVPQRVAAAWASLVAGTCKKAPPLLTRGSTP